MASTSDRGEDKGNNDLDTEDVQLAIIEEHSSSDANAPTRPLRPAPKEASGNPEASAQGRVTSDPLSTAATRRLASKRCGSAVSGGEDPLTEERHILRIRIGVQEINSIPCSSPNAVNQNSSWIKCIHSDIDPDEACFQHYLVHSLKPDTTLSTLLRDVHDRLQSQSLLGLVLVHHSDSMVLVDAFWDSDDPSNILLCTVSHRDGQFLLGLLQSQEPGEVSVTVDVESSVDVPGTTVMDHSTAEPTEAEQNATSFLQRHFGRRTGFSLSKGLSKLLEETSRGSSEVSAVYNLIFSHFWSFEKDESRTDIDKGFRLMRDRLSKPNFVHEYLLHLAIVYRVLSLPVYRHNQDPCRDYCLEFLRQTDELLHNPEQLAVLIKSFISKGDFDAADLGGKIDSFFDMMSSASQKLLNAVKSVHPVGFFGLKMLCVYVDLAFSCQVTETEGLVGRWKSFIDAEKYDKVSVNPDELKGISAAIHLGIKLGLPPQIRFSGVDLADMVVRRSKQCHFTQLMELIDAMAGSLFQDKAQLVKFIRHSHTICFPTNNKSAYELLRSMSASKNSAERALEEGVQFLLVAVRNFEDSGSSENETLFICSLCLWWGSMIDATLIHHPEAMCKAVKDLANVLKGENRSRIRTRSGLKEEFVRKFEEEMKIMSLSQFVVYLKSLTIIRSELVQQYLEGFQNRRSRAGNPFGKDFSQLLQTFFEKWPLCESAYHKMFVKEIKDSVGLFRDAKSYIPTLLSLETSHLLSDRNVIEKEIADLMELRRDFGQFLTTYIQAHKLAGVHTARCFQNSVVSITQRGRNTFTPLQQEVLSAVAKFVYLQKAHISKLIRGQDAQEIEVLRIVLAKLVVHYKEPISWGTPPTVPFTWFWEILDRTCQLVKPPIKGSFDLSWCSEGQMAVSLLAQVYSTFSEAFSVTSLQNVPDAVSRCENGHMRRYFEWVKEIQEFIRAWQQKIIDEDWTEEEIMLYANMAIPLHKMAQSLHIEALEVSIEDVTSLKTEMQKLKPLVKKTLIRIDNDGRRCSILGILDWYDVVIPPVVVDLLKGSVNDFETCLLKTVPFVEAEDRNIEFHNLRLKELRTLNEALDQFLTPIVDLIDFLVHFSMHDSHIFSQYLWERLLPPAPKVPAVPAKALDTSTVFAGLEDVILPEQDSTTESDVDTMQRFRQAVQDTQAFLKSILLGEATYGSLCSLGCFQEGIGAVDVPYELHILQTFRFPGIDQSKDMGDIKSIMELIQFADYIDNIRCVCEQYHIDGCLKDTGFERLCEIHSVLVSEEAKTELNAIRSEGYLVEIRKILYLTEGNRHALGLFAVVKDSADFYQFLKEKNFRGAEGANFFMQQHRLITSHLQHEEYNEQILNHLLVAFPYMSPFLDTDQSLEQLMNEVYRNCGQQAVRGGSTDFVQLHTVNKNVHLVRVWFSRAEGDTLENVAEDLKSLLNTGHFEFIFPESVDESPSGVPTAPVWWKEGDQRRLLLHYQPCTPPQSGEAASDATPAKRVVTPVQGGEAASDATPAKRVSTPAQSGEAASDATPAKCVSTPAQSGETASDATPAKCVSTPAQSGETASDATPAKCVSTPAQSGEAASDATPAKCVSTPAQGGEAGGDATSPKRVTWNREQIEDFTRKLGFLEKGSEDGMHFTFQRLSAIAQRVFAVQCELMNLGYPRVSRGTMKCSDLEEAEKLVNNLEERLTEWRLKLKHLRTDYDKLLFFYIPKMLRMFKMLHSGSSVLENVPQLVQEVSFLFDSTVETREHLTASLQSLLVKPRKDVQASSRFLEKTQLPIAQLGKILEALFLDGNVINTAFPRRTAPSLMKAASMGREHRCVMHVAIDLKPKDLIRLIFEIYKGIPAPYEVYRCRADSTEEELALFFQRTLRFPYLQFSILEVNMLPPKLQEVLLQLHLSLEKEEHRCSMHYVATGPCVLEDMPWVTVQEHKPTSLKYTWKQTCAEGEALLNPNHSTFAAFELVYGRAGDGKTHYIRKKMKSSKGKPLTVAINESFSAVSVIQQLRSLPEESHNVLYFSFTLLPPSEESSEVDRRLYQSIMAEVQWFLLDLFFLGYVEDPSSGLSFKIPSELNWECYFEVPSQEEEESDKSLHKFVEELPVLQLVGKVKHIQPNYAFEVDSDVQLVCKYLNAYHHKDDPIHGINRLYELPHARMDSKTPRFRQPTPVMFQDLHDLPVDYCHELLARYMPKEVRMNKTYQKLFIGYMKRRCKFLENFPGLNYNPGKVAISRGKHRAAEIVDTSQLGSTIMETMLKEVSEFCNPVKRNNWSNSTRQQLVYDVLDGGGCFHLIAVNAENMSKEEREKYQIMGTELPPSHELSTRKYLDKYLASAFNLALENGRLKVVDSQQYVLTLDYTLKMLEIHERFECGIPVIIEGETGVGKTALVEMLSILWNQSLLGDWRLLRDRVLTLLKDLCYSIEAPPDVMASYMQLLGNIQEDTPVQLEDLEKVCTLSHVVTTTKGSVKSERHIQEILASYVQQILTSPVISLLDAEAVWKERAPVEAEGDGWKYPDCNFPAMVQDFRVTQDPQATAGLLFYLLRAQPIVTFYKLNVHAALTPKDFSDFLQPVFKQGAHLKSKWAMKGSTMPKVTVFLDEINTSSCMGLLKEVLVDRTFFGQPVPDNIFIVAACNPHRGNSVVHLQKKQPSKSWVRGSYNVHRLHPTIRYLKWDYGALDSQQEEQYIKAKMAMMGHDDNKTHSDNLSILIVQSQNLMRTLAADHLKESCGYMANIAKKLAHSCVSQRDIQRVFTFYDWVYRGYMKNIEDRFSKAELEDPRKLQERAVMVALGIVYYFRLDEKSRTRYNKDLKKYMMGSMTVEEVLKEELDFYGKHLSIPRGIAKTQALLENLFCIIACCSTRTPLIIVGAPGSSKTLSFNLALSNIKGAESKSRLFRDCELFPSMDPHFYQCSRRTTSVEVETVFLRAVKRQAGFNELRIPFSCVVFMDEAGLPEESHESLKVLHKYLDSREVSFVAITNHLLDAAKTNRAASLFRASYNAKDIKTLARECLGSASPEDADAKTVEKLCDPYNYWMNNHEWFKDFFGLRDFIHMIHYLRRGKASSITHQLVMAALERNFNGCEKFNAVCKEFLRYLKQSPERLRQRNVIEILQNSLQDKPNRSLHGDQETYDEVRYKLIIDPSEDDSLSRLLLMYKILDPKKTRTFMCSDFPEDSQLQKINTIAAIRHAAVEGQTVLMSQTDDIHESFYDLFNQHFRRIDDPDPNKEPRFYANIAIGSHHKPCRVHKDFQCVVIVKKSELPNTPAPFLNRFEKYCISHKDFLDARLRSLPPCLRVAVQCALEKVHEFFNFVGESSFYGARKGESVESLALSILPSPDFLFTKLTQEAGTTTLLLADAMGEAQAVTNGAVVLLTSLISTLQEDAGFQFIKLSHAEVQDDAKHILGQLSSLPSNFKGIAQAILDNRHSREQLVSFVRDAVNHLHLAPAPERCKTEFGYSAVKDITEESCVVVMVMVQWLVLYMSKRLLQLMTAEALTLSRKRIPHWCLDSYLTHQSHFSLKDLINSNMQHASLRSTSSIGTVPTKLVCFTRSTPNIHRLPSVFPTVLSATDHRLSHEALMKDMITNELAPLYLCKLSSILSEQAFIAQLQSFTQSKEKMIMVLVINMQETSKQMVNHIRIMVEQAESSAREPQKLFVLLLHFPPSMFYNPCYPALFLNGWDHHYLDSVQPEPEGIVDIRQWFNVACQRSHNPDSQGVIVKAVKSMIPDTITIVSSRVSIGAKKGGPFNRTPTDGKDKVRQFEQLLTGPVGDGLCRMYARYWQPAGMARYLEEAALYSKDHKSTVSITDSVRDFFQTAFHNFLAYMIHIINEDLNIDIICAQNCEKVTLDLFIQLMQLLPKLPKLAEVKAYNNTWPAQQARTTTPSFPFFRRVAEAMDELLERSMEEMQTRKKPLAEASIDDNLESMPSLGGSYQKALFATLKRQLVASLESGKNPLLKAAVTAIDEHDVLWQKYWKDFVANQFHLNAGEDKLTFEILNITFARPLTLQDARKKLVALHSTAHTNQINLAKLVSSLRPLQKLQNVVETTLAPTMSPLSPNPSTMFMSVVDQSPGHVHDSVALYQFVIDTLFSALAEDCLKCGNENMNYCESEKLEVWRECYRDVTSQPSVKEILFHSPMREEPYIGRLNTMAAVFLLLQVQAELNEDICGVAFDLGQKLVELYFNDKLQMMNKCPHLREIVGSFVDILEDDPERLSRRDVTAYLESLLTFFFSPLSSELNENDVVWFLGYLNTLTSVDISQTIIGVHQDVDLTLQVEGEGPVTDTDQSPLLNVLPIAMAKRVLGEILTHPQGDEKPVPPLSIFCRKARSLVGQTLLQQDRVEGKVDCYLPLVYRQHLDNTAPPNPRMEQPLADVYFLVVMEHMLGEEMVNMRLETALNKITDISKILIHSSHNPEETVLLHIEQQAVVQMVLWKTAQSVADSTLRSSALAMSPGIINLVQDPSMGGGEDSGHELVFMMHLLEQLNGSNALLDFLNSPITADLPFLIPYKRKLTSTSEESVHLFPFMLQDAKGPLADMYRRLTRLMVAAGEDGQDGQAKTAFKTGLAEMARMKTLKGEKGNDIDAKLFLKMALWLVVYYQFYNTGKKCPHLVNVIRNQCQLLELTNKQLNLIECFLCPEEMVRSPESPLPRDANEEILELGQDGQPRLKVKQVSPDQMADPIYTLFNPPKGWRDDPSDVQLRHALANLIALAFSLPPRSTHLWYFLFGQSELEGTFLPGFMYPTKVSPKTMMYDCGVLLNEDGQFGRPDYRDHNSPLSLHSFYMIEWTTFGVLCMALLTNPDAEKEIHGHIISDWQPLRHFCLEQLRRIWLFMRCNLQLSDEERSFLILQALHSLFERGQSELLPGKFESVQQVEQYEQQWHTLYEDTTSGLGEKLKKHSQLLNLGVFKKLRILGAVYPQFPTERQFRHNLESLLSSSDPNRPKHSILAHLLDDRDRLAVGSALLPDLVEMYLWLDMHLAHLLPYEAARKMTLKEVITKASKRFSSEAGHIHELFERLTATFNRYVKLNGDVVGTGGCVRHRHDEHVTKITDSTPVIRLLSTDDSREGGKNDWLCLIMKDIISAHNNLVQMVASQGKDASFTCWLQSAPLTVEVREFSLAEALFSDNPQLRSGERLLSMIRSRYLPMVPEDPSVSVAGVNPRRTSPMFDLSKLESDVVRCFVAGKPYIKDVDGTLRRSFRFRDNKADPSTAANGLAGPGCPVDLAALSQELPQSCKAELTEDKRKGLEAEFHSASYNVLSELVTGLRTAAGYLYQTLQEKGPGVLEQTLVQFLCQYFGEEQPSNELLKRIELEEFTAEQLRALGMLPVKHLYKTLEMFVRWINDCLYDFHELPFTVKRPLPPSVPRWFEEKVAEKSASVSLDMLDDLEDTVSHIAQGLHKDSIKPSQPLRENLISVGFYGEKDAALQLVPVEVLLQHYMHFVVLLRKWKLQLQSACSARVDAAHPAHQVWVEVVPDVWERLPHFQDNIAKILFSPEDLVLDPRTMKFAFEMTEEDHYSSEHQDSDEIWLDDEESMESEPEVSKNATHWDSFEDLVGEEGDATDLSATAGQTEMEDDKTGEDQHSPGPSPIPSKHDSQPSIVSISPSQASIEQSIPASVLAREPSENAMAMTTEEVIQWLQSIKLSKYTEIFKNNEVDGYILACCALQTLEEMGIDKDLDRRKIFALFRKIK